MAKSKRPPAVSRRGSLSIVLMHYPVHNKVGDVVATAVTPFDLHDIARTAMTFGVQRYYVLTPLASQRQFAQRIVGTWQSALGKLRNWTREEAFQLIRIKATFADIIADLKKDGVGNPLIVGTSAKAKGPMTFGALRTHLQTSERPVLLLFGTGWGLLPSVLEACDEVLEPILGETGYNHLSVRSAAAIILEKVKGRNRE